MEPQEAVFRIKNSPANIRLKLLCKNLRAGKLHGERSEVLERLIEELDREVDDARSNFSGEQIAEFEECLWQEMKCYCLLSDSAIGIVHSRKMCENPGCCN